jgi:hypothetical protein
VVSVLTTEPKGRGFKPGRGDGILMAIKIRSIKSRRSHVKILRHVIVPLRYFRYL